MASRGICDSPSTYGIADADTSGQFPVSSGWSDAFPSEAGRALAAGVAELNRHLGVRLRVNDVDDACPAEELLVIPEAEASGSDAGVRRDAGHLREDHCGAAEGAGTEVDEMEVIGHPVGGTVRRHRGDDHAILERDAADGERREHWGARLIDTAALREPLSRPRRRIVHRGP